MIPKCLCRMINLKLVTKWCLLASVLLICRNLVCYQNITFLFRAHAPNRNKDLLVSQTRLANVSIEYPDDIQVKIKERKMKSIIWYDYYNEGHGLRYKGSQVNFNMCPGYKNCRRLPDFISDSQYNSVETLREADAVIFHGIHYDVMNHTIPRSPGQLFVFAEREPGWCIGTEVSNNAQYKNVFNWTMTFRTDSDVPMLYGRIFSKADKHAQLLTEEGKQARRPSRPMSYHNKVFDNKKADVVWLVSHCKTYSFREDYVAEMRKYIHVDIIGQCGQNTCPKKDAKECVAKIAKDYKFVLSFENSFQTDYVTEKLFDWFPRDIVQVVFGLAEYSEFVPHGTVINAANFDSPNHLANYMLDVGSSKEKYTRYLRRKDLFFSVGHTEMQQRAYCKLCSLLNDIDAHRKVYPDITKWWQKKNVSHVNSYVMKQVTNMVGKC